MGTSIHVYFTIKMSYKHKSLGLSKTKTQKFRSLLSLILTRGNLLRNFIGDYRKYVIEKLKLLYIDNIFL